MLLIVQYAIGWFMPDIHRGMKPGEAMTFHISIGISILAIILLRLIWRVAYGATVSPQQVARRKALAAREEPTDARLRLHCTFMEFCQ